MPKRNVSRYGARPLADVVSSLVDPVLRRKAGMTSALVAAWPEIVGRRLAETTRPLRLEWPRKYHEDDPFVPASLVVGAEPAAALRLQHETGEVVDRVNRFLGFSAVARVKLVQMPVEQTKPDRRVATRGLDSGDRERVAALTDGVEDDGLRATLKAFAEATLQRLPEGDRRKPR